MSTIYDSAKLILIPSAIKAGKLYSVKDGDFTFSRNSVKNVLNRLGVLEEKAVNVPALQWVTDKYAVNVEPQRTNKILNSNEIANWGAGLVNIVVTSNDTLSPDGTANADKVTSNGADSVVGQGMAATLGEYTLSFFVKNIDVDALIIQMSDNAVGPVIAVYNLTTHVFTYLSGEPSWLNVYANTVDYGNGWHRVSVTATSTAGDSISATISNILNTKSLYLYGVQIELGASASSYINTTSATVTRLADVCTIAPPEGTTQILEIVNGVENVILVIPETYTMPEGLISQVIMI